MRKLSLNFNFLIAILINLIFVLFVFFVWICGSAEKKAEASGYDTMLYRRSVEAQEDAAKALQDIARSFKLYVDKHD